MERDGRRMKPHKVHTEKLHRKESLSRRRIRESKKMCLKIREKKTRGSGRLVGLVETITERCHKLDTKLIDFSRNDR